MKIPKRDEGASQIGEYIEPHEEVQRDTESLEQAMPKDIAKVGEGGDGGGEKHDMNDQENRASNEYLQNKKKERTTADETLKEKQEEEKYREEVNNL